MTPYIRDLLMEYFLGVYQKKKQLLLFLRLMEVYVAPINLEQYLQLNLLHVNHGSRCNEITTCKSCQLHGDFIHQPPLSFYTWGLDITGIIKPKYSQLYWYILATMDYFSKWTEAMPSKSVKAEDVANFLRTQNFTLSCYFQNNFR